MLVKNNEQFLGRQARLLEISQWNMHNHEQATNNPKHS